MMPPSGYPPVSHSLSSFFGLISIKPSGESSTIAILPARDSETCFVRDGETDPERRNRPLRFRSSSMAPRSLAKTPGASWASSSIVKLLL
jgi:hypothetical protein